MQVSCRARMWSPLLSTISTTSSNFFVSRMNVERTEFELTIWFNDMSLYGWMDEIGSWSAQPASPCTVPTWGTKTSVTSTTLMMSPSSWSSWCSYNRPWNLKIQDNGYWQFKNSRWRSTAILDFCICSMFLRSLGWGVIIRLWPPLKTTQYLYLSPAYARLQ